MARRSPWLVPLLLLAHATALANSAVLEQRIERIENGLLPPVLVKGEAPQLARLADAMATAQVPGVSVAVLEDGKIAWARGYGVISVGGAPVTPQTLFQAASISKPVSAVAVMQLVQAGKLDLDADVNGYLKSWKVPSNDFTTRERVTLRRLLTSAREYFQKELPARFEFLEPAGADGTALILDENERRRAATRLPGPESQALSNEALAVSKRVREQRPLPDSEVALRKLVAGLRQTQRQRRVRHALRERRRVRQHLAGARRTDRQREDPAAVACGADFSPTSVVGLKPHPQEVPVSAGFRATSPARTAH